MDVGDQVQWEKIKRSGSTITISLLRGEVKKVSASGYAMVRPDGKARSIKVHMSKLNPDLRVTLRNMSKN